MMTIDIKAIISPVCAGTLSAIVSTGCSIPKYLLRIAISAQTKLPPMN